MNCASLPLWQLRSALLQVYVSPTGKQYLSYVTAQVGCYTVRLVHIAPQTAAAQLCRQPVHVQATQTGKHVQFLSE